jgi:CheY-like chemotaxis protein
VDEPIAEAKTDMVSRLAAEGGETILLVEDEAVVRDLVRQILQGTGYAVLETETGEEALQVCHQYAGPIHLLLADVVLPGMSGPALAQRLAPARPRLRVLYMSGYAQDIIAHHGMLDRPGGYLQKPFTPDALLSQVRETLDAALTY